MRYGSQAEAEMALQASVLSAEQTLSIFLILSALGCALLFAWVISLRRKNVILMSQLLDARRNLAAFVEELRLKGLTDAQLEGELRRLGFLNAKDLLFGAKSE